MGRLLLRVLCASAGGGLLLLIARHVNPWQMEAVRLERGRVVLEAFGVVLDLAPWTVALVILVLLGVPIVAALRTVGSFDHKPSTRRLALVAAVAVLLLTLIPNGRGRGVVLELALGSAGLGLLLAGVPLLRLAERAERFWNSARRVFLEMPAAWLLLAAFGFVFLVANLGSYLLFGHIPHIVDGVAQSFHGKIFLSGQLTAPAPPAGFFELTHMIDDPRWYSQYPPGHALLLAAGHLVGAPWLVNPLAGSLSVVLLYFIGREAFGESTGRLSLLLGSLSPFLILISSSFMNHATTLFFLGLGLLGFVRMTKRVRLVDALTAGFGVGCAVSIRPLTAVAFAIPLGLHAAIRAGKLLVSVETRVAGRRYLLLSLVALAAFAVPAGGLLAYNAATNSDPFLSGYEVLHGEDALPGFGKQGWGDVPHTPGRGFAATLRNANVLNQYLFGWPFPSLAFALLGLAWVRLKIWDGVLVGSALSVALAYFFYWYQDLTLGPRFLYAAIGPLILLTARGLEALPGALSPRDEKRAARLGGALGLVIAFSVVYAVAVKAPVLAGYYSRNFADGNRAVLEALDGEDPAPSVVFVPSPYYPTLFAWNDPLLEGPVVYARDLGAVANRELLERFPDRSAYRLVAGEHYEIVPYEARTERPTYRVASGQSLTVEATSFQVSHLGRGSWRDLKMGDFGGGFKHHDQLATGSAAAGAEVGFVLQADRAQRRSISIGFGKAPDFGIVTVALNRSSVAEGIDLYSTRVAPTTIHIPAVDLRQGSNRLLIRVVDKAEASRGFGMGIDYVTVE